MKWGECDKGYRARQRWQRHSIAIQADRFGDAETYWASSFPSFYGLQSLSNLALRDYPRNIAHEYDPAGVFGDLHPLNEHFIWGKLSR